MSGDKLGAVAVVDGGRLSGIFTYSDLVNRVIMQKLDPEAARMEEVMTRQVVTMDPDGAYGKALRIMVENDYTYLPIVREDGHFEGMLSLRELLEHRIDHLASELDAVTQYIAVDGPGGD
jgi:CBS domain-containing protein